MEKDVETTGMTVVTGHTALLCCELKILKELVVQ